MRNNSRWEQFPPLEDPMDADLNVEVCSSNEAVKYLYKYLYKGPDRAMLNVANYGALVSERDARRGQLSRTSAGLWRCARTARMS